MDITADSIMLQPFPQVEENCFDPEAEAEIEWLKEVIVAVRNIRAESNIAPSKGLDLLFRNLSRKCKNSRKTDRSFKSHGEIRQRSSVSRKRNRTTCRSETRGQCWIARANGGFINKEAELARLTKEIEKYQNEVKRIEE